MGQSKDIWLKKTSSGNVKQPCFSTIFTCCLSIKCFSRDTCSENVLGTQNACEGNVQKGCSKRASRLTTVLWSQPAIHSQAHPSQLRLHVRHVHLNPVCLRFLLFFFFTHKATTKLTATRGTSTGPTGTLTALVSKRGLMHLQRPILLFLQCVHVCCSDLQQCRNLQHLLKD